MKAFGCVNLYPIKHEVDIFLGVVVVDITVSGEHKLSVVCFYPFKNQNYLCPTPIMHLK